MADRIADEVYPSADRPITLLGHSMGATIAFEVASRLEKRGIVPLALFASARGAPSQHHDGSIHSADDARLISELKSFSGTEAQVLANEEILRMILPTLRSDYRAVETYRFEPGPPLNCPITVLAGDADPHVTLDEARAWDRHTVAPFRMRVFTGGHFFINAHAEAVIREISEQISRCQGACRCQGVCRRAAQTNEGSS